MQVGSAVSAKEILHKEELECAEYSKNNCRYVEYRRGKRKVDPLF